MTSPPVSSPGQPSAATGLPSNPEERLRLALEVSGTGIWEVDFDTGGVTHSANGLALLGYGPGDIPPTIEGWNALIHPHDVTAAREAFEAHLAGDTPRFEREYRLRGAGGDWRWLHDRGEVISRFGDGSPRRAIGGFIDVTARRQTEERIRQSLAALADAQAVGRLGSFVADIASGALEVSTQTYRLFGLAEGTLRAVKEVVELVHADDQEALRAAWAASHDGVATRTSLRIRLGGDQRWIDLRLQARFDWRGKPVAVLGTVQDITEFRRSQLTLEMQHSLALALARSTTREEILRAVLDTALAIDPLDAGGIYLRQDDGSLRLLVHRGLSHEFVAAIEHLPANSPQTRLIEAGRLICSCHQPSPYCTDEELVLAPHIAGEGLRSLVFVPIATTGAAPAACLYLGSRRSGHIGGELTGMLEAFTLQVAESLVRLDAMDSARHLQANLGGLFNALDDFLFVIDAEGRIIEANQAVFDRLGFAPADLRGESALKVRPPELHDEVRRTLEAILGGRQNTCLLPLLDAAGQRIPVETRFVRGRWDDRPVLFGLARDIAARLSAESQLRLAASVFDHAQEGIMIADADGVLRDVNAAFTAITGYSRAEAVGQRPSLLHSERQDPAIHQEMWRTLNAEGHWRGEIWDRRKNGVDFAAELSLSSVKADNRVTHYVGIFSDVTLAREQQQRLERLAHYDALTHLPNRSLLTDRLQQAMSHARRENRLLAVCYLDLDGFKPVNDRHGHDAGDRLLTEVAARLREAVRGTDTVARMGGDEFVLLLGELATVLECEHAVERALAAVALPFQVASEDIAISASIGVTIYPSDDADGETLLRNADQAMYAAKQAGRNRYALFDPEQDRRLRTHRADLHRLGEALQRGEFELFYQPRVDMRAGRVVGIEALARWRHPERGLLPPADFLPAIEASDLVLPFGRWVLGAALDQMQRWLAAGMALTLSINVSGRHLLADGFVDQLAAALAEHGELPPGLIELDIRETVAIEDLGRIAELITDCRRLGVSVALDDFGTGYSSLTYLRHLPVDTVKIDLAFVRAMLADHDDRAIVEGVIGVARAFRRRLVAEGVESAAHGATLLDLGCDCAQGYGIAHPMPAADLAAWVAAYTPDRQWSASP